MGHWEGMRYYQDNERFVEIDDISAEIFSMWAGRILITAESKKWALAAAEAATGFATSIIMSPTEAAIERFLPPEKTPDSRLGVLIQIYDGTPKELRNQIMLRIGQCIMPCPTTAVYDAMSNAKKRLKIGRSLGLYGDGFQSEDEIGGRRIWRVPVMEGEFIVEDKFGAVMAVAGGTMLLMADSQKAGL